MCSPIVVGPACGMASRPDLSTTPSCTSINESSFLPLIGRIPHYHVIHDRKGFDSVGQAPIVPRKTRVCAMLTYVLRVGFPLDTNAKTIAVTKQKCNW